jgi:hypothetical protein
MSDKILALTMIALGHRDVYECKVIEIYHMDDQYSTMLSNEWIAMYSCACLIALRHV